jgi:leucyl aminopeptidase
MIEYIPNFSDLPKQFIVLEILWKKGTKPSKWTNKMPSNLVETFPIFQDHIYTDLQNSTQKIQALKLTWDNDDKNADSKNIILFLQHNLIHEQSEIFQHIVSSFVSALYPSKSRRIILTHEGPHMVLIEKLLNMVNVVQRAREMAMTPANIATPAYMVRNIKKMFKNVKGCTTTIFTSKELKKKHFGLIEAVGQSSNNKPYMVIVERKPITISQTKHSKRICLIGKGVTFDSGGLSVKSFDGMYDMKYDKIGAVYMAHIMHCLSQDENLNGHHLVAILPFAENAISEKSLHPGDVIRSHNGMTVEISDPDAEGRLLLADAFSYANHFKPDILIDLATLTGHSDSINCWHYGYVFCEPETLKPKIEKLSYHIGERMLTMPSWIEHRTILRSDNADLINSPIGCSDAFVAALFLREFLPSSVKKWIHIDLAHEYDNHTPLGNGIRTIHEIVHMLCKEDLNS